MAYSARLFKNLQRYALHRLHQPAHEEGFIESHCPKPFLVTTGRIFCLFVLLVHSQHRPKRLSFSLAGPRGHYFLLERMQRRRSPPILLARTDIPRCEQSGEFPESPKLGYHPQKGGMTSATWCWRSL